MIRLEVIDMASVPRFAVEKALQVVTTMHLHNFIYGIVFLPRWTPEFENIEISNIYSLIGRQSAHVPIRGNVKLEFLTYPKSTMMALLLELFCLSKITLLSTTLLYRPAFSQQSLQCLQSPCDVSLLLCLR